MLATSNAVRLFQISDTHCYASDDARLTWTDMPIYPNQSLQAILAHLLQKVDGYKAMILTGDLAQEEIPDTYQRLNEILNGFPLPVFTIPGNHDAPEYMQRYLKGKISMPDEVVLDNWHLLFLDTHSQGMPDGHLTEEQFLKFSDLLEALPSDHYAVVFMHHHPVPINSEWMDVMGLQQKHYFWRLVELFPQVKAVFNGHIHQEFMGKHTYATGREVMVYGTPATCVQLKPLRQNIEFDHNLPAWRDIILHADGSIETAVHYLPFTIRTEDIRASI